VTGAGTRWIALAAGGLGLLAWLVALAVSPLAAVQGWLIGFVFICSLSVGTLVTLLIHRLTGGRWGPAFAPELAPAAAATPALLVFSVPVLLGAGRLYPWAASPETIAPDVRSLFLNLPLFWLTTLAALGGWSVLALSLRRIEGPQGRLWAALGLAFYGLTATVVSIYWVESVVPSFTSSNFGMEFVVEQLAAGFAFAGLQGRRRAADPSSGDMSGLLFATVIGLSYLEFMAYLVTWYGDRPPLDAWYLDRARWPWQVLSWIGLAAGIAAVILLTIRRAMGAHRALAWASGCVLAGVLAYQTWQLAPSFGSACLGPAALALLAMGGLWLAAAGGWPRAAVRTGALARGG
jgi:hypothetical protein